MRVISLVPSLTETLIAAGVNVVGRTRFCIHPQEAIKSIPIVGGTKNLDLAKIKALMPDLVILDREENTKSMAEQLEGQWHATHVDSLDQLENEFTHLSQLLKAPVLETYKAELKKARTKIRYQSVREKLQIPDQPLVYVIWKDPWMAVGPGTFIWSMLCELGFAENMQHGFSELQKCIEPASSLKYPKFNLEILNPDIMLLLSSEPYPFGKKINELKIPHAKMLVDGEHFSWFGIRSLRFLQTLT